MRQSFTISMIALIFITLVCGGGAAGGGLPGSAASPFSGSVSTAFTAGISHIAGKYRFTRTTIYLRVHRKSGALGSSSIFYLTPSFRSDYPDESTTWPTADRAGVDGLARTGPYDQVFHLPFETFVMTTLTFANADQVQGIAQSQDRLNAEENESYQLTKYLYSRFSGPGKTFVLKNWETDGFAA